MKPYYEESSITIYHGDCREVLPTLEQADLVLTDPPYAVSAGRSEWKITASVGTGIHLAANKVRKGGAMLVFSTSSGRGIEYTLGAVGRALPFNRLLTWHKSFVRSRVAGPWRWDVVTILAFGRASFGRPMHSSCFQSVGPASTNHLGSATHPAELPVAICEWLYSPFDRDDLVLLDPFLGTGTLLMQAASLGRRAIGIEIEERYCEIAVKRLRQEVLPFSGNGNGHFRMQSELWSLNE